MCAQYPVYIAYSINDSYFSQLLELLNSFFRVWSPEQMLEHWVRMALPSSSFLSWPRDGSHGKMAHSTNTTTALKFGQLFCPLKGFPSNLILSDCLPPLVFLWPININGRSNSLCWKQMPRDLWKETDSANEHQWGEWCDWHLYQGYMSWKSESFHVCMCVRLAGSRALGPLLQA